MYAIVLNRHAARALRRMERRQAEAVRIRLAELARDPRGSGLDVKKLVGRAGYRLRVGDWRVLYEIDDVVRIIAIEDIVQRGRAYR
ncbi:type II toxin-antitoxin system RelE family toxin [Marinimicrococcus flavescens]|uniref:type II toxin-antitoxin system RelE family toxin n=1 Tax=Marinimicrococcus flavescens TaxID=3031815 RepID=UPI0038990AC8